MSDTRIPTIHTRVKINNSSTFNASNNKKPKTTQGKCCEYLVQTNQTPSLSYQLKNNLIHPSIVEIVSKQYFLKNNQSSTIDTVQKPSSSEVKYNNTLLSLLLAKNDKLHNKAYMNELKNQNNMFISKFNLQLEALNTLQNKIIDMKGAIRVHCRINPFSKPNLFNITTPTTLLGKYSLEIIKSVSQTKQKLSQIYYKENNNQIFNEVRDFTLSIFSGYNVSLFMYGQTGSGKTHTLFGSKDEKGLIELIVEQIYVEKQERKIIKENVNISISATELYNDSFTDLLEATKNKIGRNKINKEFVKSFYDFKQTSIVPKDKQHVIQIIRNISKLKTTASTLLNDKSSRSHTIVSITLSIGEGGKESTLTLVDLAGSERINKSKATGIRLEEAKFINLSLSSLGLCINSLNNKRSHVPYRNSILTQFLEKGIGGNSRTMFVVNVKIEEDSLRESENTMKFAGDLIKVKGKKITN